MHWPALFISGLMEALFPLLIVRTDGFSKLPAIGLLVAIALASLVLLQIAMRRIPLGIAYAAWTGIGIGGSALIGMAWLGEPRSAVKIACLLLLVLAIGGLHRSTGRA